VGGIGGHIAVDDVVSMLVGDRQGWLRAFCPTDYHPATACVARANGLMRSAVRVAAASSTDKNEHQEQRYSRSSSMSRPRYRGVSLNILLRPCKSVESLTLPNHRRRDCPTKAAFLLRNHILRLGIHS